MMYPLVLDLAADGIPVTVTCRVLGSSTQAFYKWHKQPITQCDWDDAHLLIAARDMDPLRRTRRSGTASSPTNLPARGSSPERTGSLGYSSQRTHIWSVFAHENQA